MTTGVPPATICVIPARGGSKRIPHKNVRDFAGRPMIAWPIRTARSTGLFDRIVVSTEDADIARIAAAWGGEVPFTRPDHLADDHATTLAVMAHAVAALGLPDDAWVCCLYAAAPLVAASDIVAGARLLATAPGSGHVLSVVSYGHPIQRALRLGGDGAVGMIEPRYMQTRTQDLETAYHDAGQFYWAHAGRWRAQTPIFGEGARAVVLPSDRVQDIDTEEDWRRAELIGRLSGRFEDADGDGTGGGR